MHYSSTSTLVLPGMKSTSSSSSSSSSSGEKFSCDICKAQVAIEDFDQHLRTHERRGDDIKQKQDEEYAQTVREETIKQEEKANKERQDKVCSIHCCSLHSFETQIITSTDFRYRVLHSCFLSPSLALPIDTCSNTPSHIILSHRIISYHIISLILFYITPSHIISNHIMS